MPLQPGSRVGSYEILDLLGEGGMGQVYRARDLRLNRDVAVKVLPANIRHDPDRLLRFEREAQALAALNHPNIATVHGIEDSDGEPVLVMELVDGPTLAERLREGPLPVEDARTLALQIAEALDAAHEQGIVHRDLKPANIKIRPDGTLKILDFGLAKIFAPPDGNQQAALANSPTITSPMTTAGVVLGTAAYMSPEQARGRPVDKRADIWAFGCVLYEMLTGRAAFEGETTTDVMAGVVQREPDWSRLPAALPPSIASLLRRCLQKNARDRLRDIGDARTELRAAPAEQVLSPPAGPARRTPFAAVAGLAFLAGALITGAALYAWLTTRETRVPQRPATRVAIVLPEELTLSLGRGSAVVVSPDGRRVVFVAQQGASGTPQLYLRDLARFEATPVDGTEGAESPFFSPDGRWVGFFADGRLKKVSLEGGAPVGLADARAPRGHAWLQDNGILVTPFNNVALSRVPADGGQPQPFTSLAEGELSHRWPYQLPDASAVLFTIWNDTGFEASSIVAQRAGSTERGVIVEAGGAYPRFVRDPTSGRGYLVYARSEGLLAAPFDASALKVTGSPVPIVDGVLTNLSGGAHFDLGANGTLAYIPGAHAETEREFVWVTLEGKRTPVLRKVQSGRFFALDRSGKRVLRVTTVGSRDLWIDDLERPTSTRLTNNQDVFSGVWSPDGNWVIYPKGSPFSNLHRVSTDGRGSEERLTSIGRTQQPTDTSRDGAWLAYWEIDPVSGPDIWVMKLPAPGTAPTAKPETRRFVQSKAVDSQAKFSPDGTWLAYQSGVSGRMEIYVRSFPDGERTVQVSTEGGLQPSWSESGTNLYFRSPRGSMMTATLNAGAEASISGPRTLFDARGYENAFGVSPDGKRFLMMPLVSAEASASEIRVVLDFVEELRQRVR